MATRWTPEDYYRLQAIESPALAPDGLRAVYVRAACRADHGERETHLRLVSRERDRQLTAGPKDTGPALCPEGGRVAFLSERTEKKQIHLIAVDGGEARAITSEETPIPPLKWSPEGTRIAFRARVADTDGGPRYPGEPEAVRSPDKDEEDTEEGEGPRVITDMLYRRDRDGFIHDTRPQLFLANPTTGEIDRLTASFCEHEHFTWRPDGERLAYTVRKYDRRRVVFTTTVWELDPDTGAAEKVLEWDGSINQLCYGPSGRRLLFAATENRDPMGTAVAHLWSLEVGRCSLPAENQHARNLTAGIDRSVMGRFRYSPRDGAIYFALGDQGQVRLHRLPLRGKEAGQPNEVETARTGVISDLDVAAESGALLYRAESFSHPPQLFLQDGDEAVQLTDVNQKILEKRELVTAEAFTCQGPDDWEVPGWVVRPGDGEPGRPHPAVVSVHGGPNGVYLDRFDFGFQLLASNGFVVILTNPRGSVTYGRRFARGVIRDWGGGDYGDILAGLDHAVEEGIADPARVGIMGWSYGGYMTLWSITQTDRFAAAVAGANISNIYSLWGTSDIAPVYNQALNGAPAFDDEEQYMGRSPLRYVRNARTPVLLLHGEADVRTPIGQSEQFFTALKRLGREAVFVRYPGQNHGLSLAKYVVDRWHRTLAWFDHHLQK